MEKEKSEKVSIENRIFNILHLVKKAGELKMGFGETERLINRRKAKLILIAKDLQENSRQKIIKMCSNNMSFFEFSNKKSIGIEFGKRDLGILSISNANFSKGIIKILKSEREDLCR